MTFAWCPRLETDNNGLLFFLPDNKEDLENNPNNV